MNQITSFPDALYPWDSLLFRESEGAEWERLGNVGASSGKRRTFSTRSEKKPDFVWTRRKKRCCYPARKARFCKRVGIHTAEPCHPLGFHGILAGRRFPRAGHGLGNLTRESSAAFLRARPARRKPPGNAVRGGFSPRGRPILSPRDNGKLLVLGLLLKGNQLVPGEPCRPLGFHGILAGRRPSTLGLRFLFREMQNPPNFKRFSPESCVEKKTRGSGVFLQCTHPHWRKTPDPLVFFSTGHSGNFLNKFQRISDPGPQNLRASMAG